MNIKQLVDILVSAIGSIVAVTYLVGGLIVNIHLSRYSITQYQIVKVKYLVVGLTYITNLMAILLLAAVPSVLLIRSTPPVRYITLASSLLASILLLWLWGNSSTSKPFVSSWSFWVIIGSLASLSPLATFTKLGLTIGMGGSVAYDLALDVGLACLAGILSFVSQTYYYARHLYGKQHVLFGSTDVIGMGIPVQVQLTGEANGIARLANVGVPMLDSETTAQVTLLDETAHHYIVGTSTTGNKLVAVEVTKDIVQAMRYCGVTTIPDQEEKPK